MERHYKGLLNSVTNCKDRAKVINALSDIDLGTDVVVSPYLVSSICSKLERGKSPGPDSLPGEAFKFANNKLYVLLSLCFTACFVHGFLPDRMIESMIVPLVKNKCGNVSDKNNYRPIA